MSYKITKPHVKPALELLKKNEQLTMNELEIEMKKINIQHLILRLQKLLEIYNKIRKESKGENSKDKNGFVSLEERV